jgi:triosephosphate isomerase
MANWKAQFSPARAERWCREFIASYRPVPDVEVVLAVPFLYLFQVENIFKDIQGVSLAAQTVSSYPQGSYTGSIPAAWLEGHVKYALLGHQERRKYFHEGVQDIARQARECLAEEVQPIICVDIDDFTAQLASFDLEQSEQLIWAYTPKGQIFLEQKRLPASIGENIARIRERTGGQPVLYGGGVSPGHSKALMEIEGVSGILAGRSCFDAGEFAEIIHALA